jgi:DNA-binding GntR family transcriptional regulator
VNLESLDDLVTEARSVEAHDHDLRSTRELVELMNREDAGVPAAVAAAADEIAATIDAAAARLAAGGRTEVDLAALQNLVEETREATSAGDVPRLVELNHAFHEGVWRAARNRYLAGELRLLRSLIEGRQDTTLRSGARQVESLAEHAELLELLRRGDGSAAEELTRRHFQAAMALRLTNV